MIIITGGAGFIGSALLWALNKRGESDILIVDTLDHDEKEKNLAALQYESFVEIDDFRRGLLAGDYDNSGVRAVFHMGAISSTMEQDWTKLKDNNVEYTKDIIRWCVDRNVRCIYASSAQAYGGGENGYSDDPDIFDDLKTITLYGKSKLDVDIWARDAGYLDEVVGLRYFNVFGPNENHKENMRSVINKLFPEVRDKNKISLFKSYDSDFQNGEQQRDFVYIKDAVEATLFFWDHPELTGVYNIGTGKASTWNEIARDMFSALGKKPNITYIDMPEVLKKRYQYFTQADISKLNAAGYKKPFTPLKEAIKDYITNYLVPDKHLSEE